MGLRLLVLYWCTPKFVIRRELQNIASQTESALKELLPKDASIEVDANLKQLAETGIEEQRSAMAENQVKLVAALQAAFGREEAVKLGREASFLVGKNLGKQTRRRLGVGDSSKDLIKAAKILYRVLGIEFHLEWLDNSNVHAVIDRCALAEHYSELACEVLSATDEGVVKGLQSDASMKFEKYMTSGCKTCMADIHFSPKETG
jgi:hypothetical protein